MSEVQSRPAASRGRGSSRGGRGGGYSTRGGNRAAARSPAAPNGDSSKQESESALPTLEDEGEMGHLKQLYGGKVGLIQEMFPDWSDIDILYALLETDGDESLAVTRIAEGSISQWGEVSKQKKERVRTKAKNDTFTTTTADSTPVGHTRPPRGGRVGAEGGRGRGRATDRGGRGAAGRGKSSHPATNGTRAKDQPLSVPTEDSPAWETTKTADESTGWGDSADAPDAPDAPDASAASRTATLASPATLNTTTPVPLTTWARVASRQLTTAKPTPPPSNPIVPVAQRPSHTEPITVEPTTSAEPEPQPPVPAEEPSVELPESPVVVVPEIALEPSKDQLTETNLEQVMDDSNPPVTETAASEAADSWDQRATGTSAIATPISASQQEHQQRHQQLHRVATAAAAAAGAPAPAPKASKPTGRKFGDQIASVEMPYKLHQHPDLGMPKIQFLALENDNSDNSAGDNVDNNLEDNIDNDLGDNPDSNHGENFKAETRAPFPIESPLTKPRVALHHPQPAPTSDAFPSKPVATIAPPTGPAAALSPPSQPSAASQVPPPVQNTQQFRSTFVQESPALSSPQQQQQQQQQHQQQQQLPTAAPPAPSPFEGSFATQSQSSSQPQPQQQPASAFSSTPSEYSSYYTADHQNRSHYNNYYNQQFSQQHGSEGQQEALPSQQQRSSGGGYTAPQNENLSQYPQSTTTHHTQGRYGAASAADIQNSGNTTPNPSAATQGQQQAAQGNQSQSHAGQQPHDFPYSHPYFTSPYYTAAYMNSYQGGYNQGGYGGPYAKGGLYGQPHQYGMSPQGPYGHGSSPASGFGQSSLHRADVGIGAAGLGEYGRAGSAQSANQPGLGGGSGFGGMHDAFGRGASSYQSQAGQSFNAPTSQQGNPPVASDDLKPFGDAKTAAGPSPSLATAARPGSATNNPPSQVGLPPPQSNQQGNVGYGGYPSHLQGHGLHGAQSGAGGYGMSASGGQGHGNNPYGGYGGQQGFGGSYYGNQPRGWGGNYGH